MGLSPTKHASLGERASLLRGNRAPLNPSPLSASAPPPRAPPIRRLTLLRALEVREHRFRHCRSLPLSLLCYAAFIATLLLHARSSVAYDLQAAAAAAFVRDSGFSALNASAAGWYAWAAGGFLPLLLPAEGSSAPTWAQRPLNGYTVVVGGARLAQARSVAVECSEDAGLRALYATPCYPSTQLSRAPFGDAPNASVAAAFAPGPSRGPEGGGGIPYPFELLLDAQGSSLGAGAAAVAALRAGGWLDGATRSVVATAVLFNGQTAAWATVRLTMDVQRGGRLVFGSRVGVFPADPYGTPPEALARAGDGSGGSEGGNVPGALLVFLDLVVVGYFCYLARGTVHRVWTVLRGGGRGRGAALCGYWLVLDYATLLAMAVMIGTWGAFVAAAAGVRGEFVVPAPSAPLFASAAFAGTAARVMVCQEAWDDFKVAATLALICLSLRLFKYFKFQPRLAVMTDSLSMACSDGAHFAFLFAVMLVCYGTWGSFMFGHAAEEWSSVNLSVLAVFKFMMYDYDFEAMSASFPLMAAAFYTSMMLLLTNMVLWMFLAIVLESYTEVRARSHGSPSLLDDTQSALAALPPAAALLHAATCGACGVQGAGLGDIIEALREGRLRGEEEVEAADLVDSVPYLQLSVAEELIADALAWSAGAQGGGDGGGGETEPVHTEEEEEQHHADRGEGGRARDDAHAPHHHHHGHHFHAPHHHHGNQQPRRRLGGAGGGGGARSTYSSVRAAIARGDSFQRSGELEGEEVAVAPPPPPQQQHLELQPASLRARAAALGAELERAAAAGGGGAGSEALLAEAARLVAYIREGGDS